jgi:AhpD family alkylhydroperoxidase
MKKRNHIAQTQPKGYQAMYALVDYLKSTNIPSNFRQLIKLRASQINGCAYCLEMHTEESKKEGLSIDKLMLLSAWRESSYFNEQERAVLALAEEVTLIHQGGVSDKTYDQAVSLFGEEYVAQLIMETVTINAWNRIAISTHAEFRQHADANAATVLHTA